MDSRARALIEQGDHLFKKRGALLSLWQEIADNFYPERGGFTTSRRAGGNWGQDFAAHLTTSYPLLARRDLGNAFSAMLRPTAKEWFSIHAKREEQEDRNGRAWLEWATGVQRRAMFDRGTQFTRATKEGDHDFAAFGQCALTVELNADRDALLYRCWHLADVAWCENAEGRIDTVHRKWKPTARDLARLFPDNPHATVARLAMEKPYTEVEVRHVVIPADQYGEGAAAEVRRRTPYMSIYIDVENQHVLEEVGVFNPIYVIPRWQTVSGSPYAHSPATVAALPDARLIQAMTQALLDAGEKAASPPLLGVQEAIRSDIQVFAGGITWVDAEYDERLGEVLRPLTQDLRGLPIGVDMADRTRAMIAEAFFLNKLSMPSAGGPEMTAFEVGQRVQEYIRQAMPIFEPMEAEYNGALCETTFDLLLRAGAFGSPDDIPPSLRGMEVQFHFESPLHDATERQKSQRFMEGRAILAQALELDPGAASMIDARTALRDVLTGIGIPAAWTRDDKAMAEIEAAAQKQQQAAAMLAEVQQAAEAAEQVGRAGESLKQSGALQGAQAIGEALGQGTP